MSMRLGGLISGADTETLISAMLELERVRIYRQEEQQSAIEAKQRAWRLCARRSPPFSPSWISCASDALPLPESGTERRSVATVTADAGAAQTSYTLQVVKLAQSHVITTQNEGLQGGR